MTFSNKKPHVYYGFTTSIRSIDVGLYNIYTVNNSIRAFAEESLKSDWFLGFLYVCSVYCWGLSLNL